MSSCDAVVSRALVSESGRHDPVLFENAVRFQFIVRNVFVLFTRLVDQFLSHVSGEFVTYFDGRNDLHANTIRNFVNDRFGLVPRIRQLFPFDDRVSRRFWHQRFEATVLIDMELQCGAIAKG